MHVEMRWHSQDGVRLPVALWCLGPGYRMISSGVAGGGIGPREWVLNAQVPASYARVDPAVHVAELAAGLGLVGEGVGLLTAARVTDGVQGEEEGVRAAATVGLGARAGAAVGAWRRAAQPDHPSQADDLEFLGRELNHAA
jgi:adenosylcobinamide amidohydrolase